MVEGNVAWVLFRKETPIIREPIWANSKASRQGTFQEGIYLFQRQNQVITNLYFVLDNEKFRNIILGEPEKSNKAIVDEDAYYMSIDPRLMNSIDSINSVLDSGLAPIIHPYYEGIYGSTPAYLEVYKVRVRPMLKKLREIQDSYNLAHQNFETFRKSLPHDISSLEKEENPTYKAHMAKLKSIEDKYTKVLAEFYVIYDGGRCFSDSYLGDSRDTYNQWLLDTRPTDISIWTLKLCDEYN